VYIWCGMAESAELANQRPGGAMTGEEIVLGPLPKGITRAKVNRPGMSGDSIS